MEQPGAAVSVRPRRAKHGLQGFLQHRGALGAVAGPGGRWAGWEAVDPFRRLRIFADAYERTEDERRRLPQSGAEAARLSHDRMAHNARTLGGGWARMWTDGVGGLIRRGRWLEDNAPRPSKR